MKPSDSMFHACELFPKTNPIQQADSLETHEGICTATVYRKILEVLTSLPDLDHRLQGPQQESVTIDPETQTQGWLSHNPVDASSFCTTAMAPTGQPPRWDAGDYEIDRATPSHMPMYIVPGVSRPNCFLARPGEPAKLKGESFQKSGYASDSEGSEVSTACCQHPQPCDCFGHELSLNEWEHWSVVQSVSERVLDDDEGDLDEGVSF
jgi:hypothetical protein